MSDKLKIFGYNDVPPDVLEDFGWTPMLFKADELKLWPQIVQVLGGEHNISIIEKSPFSIEVMISPQAMANYHNIVGEQNA